MKQGIAKFSKEFVSEAGLKEWAGLEISFDMDMEREEDALKRVEAAVMKRQLQKSYLMHHDNIHPAQYAPSKIMEPDQVVIGVTVDDILSCQDVITLDSYRLIIKGKPDHESAYKTRREQLLKKKDLSSFESLDDNK